MKTFDEILPSFLATVKIKSKNTTYLSYVSTTRIFSEWLAQSGFKDTQLAHINAEIIERFSVYLAENLDRPTCQKYNTNLRQVFKYAMSHGEISSIPFDLFVLPQKREDNSAQVIPSDHNKILLEDIRKHDRQLYLACLTEYCTFVRPGKELRLMKVGDIDFTKGTITVRAENAKNGKKRTLTMPDQLLAEYKAQRIHFADKKLYVFGARKKPDVKPCSVNMLGYRFRKYRNRNKLSSGYKLYSFKHSGASVLHKSGVVSMREMMDHLGHSNMASSQHYIRSIGAEINQEIKTQFPKPY